MIRSVLSVVVALVASVVGLALLWIGGVQVYTSQQQFIAGGPLAAPGGVVLVVLGVLLLAATGYSIRLSGLGAIVVGALHVLAGVLALALPVTLGGGDAPVWNILFSLGDVSRELSDGAVVFTARGAGIILGFLLVGAGVAALLRRPAGSTARIVAAVAGGVALLVVAGLGFAQGSQVYFSYFVVFDPDPLAAVLLVVAAVAAGAAAFSLRWSSLGAIVAGALLILVGVICSMTLGLPSLLPRAASFEVAALASLGILQAVGAVLVGAGLGLVGRREPARLAD